MKKLFLAFSLFVLIFVTNIHSNNLEPEEGNYRINIDKRPIYVRCLGISDEKNVISSFKIELEQIYNNLKTFFPERKLQKKWIFFNEEENPIYLVHAAPWYIKKSSNINKKNVEHLCESYPQIIIEVKNNKLDFESFFNKINMSLTFLIPGKIDSYFSGYVYTSIIEYLSYYVLTKGNNLDNYVNYYSMFINSLNEIDMDNDIDLGKYVFLSYTNKKEKSPELKKDRTGCIFPGFYVFVKENAEKDQKFSEFFKKINRIYTSKKEKKITKSIKTIIKEYYGDKVNSSFLNYNTFWKENKDTIWKGVCK